MVKSPLEYFASQTFEAGAQAAGSEMSAAELAFIRKYMGMDASRALAAVPPVEGPSAIAAPPPVAPPIPASSPMAPSPAAPPPVSGPLAQAPGVSAVAGPAPAEIAPAPAVQRPAAPVSAPPAEASIETSLREADSVQMVGFFVGSQIYALPTLAIQEVIRRQEISQLPMAPDFVSGVINLRGHITPLIQLRSLLDLPAASAEQERFTIICRCRGLQFGVQIDGLQTMYRVQQEDLNWNAEASVGANVEFITGLFEVEGRLIPIISVDRLVAKILDS
jgi:purine-binding chemotaxis protein CheW